jgi:hypothetical protein
MKLRKDGAKVNLLTLTSAISISTFQKRYHATLKSDETLVLDRRNLKVKHGKEEKWLCASDDVGDSRID